MDYPRFALWIQTDNLVVTTSKIIPRYVFYSRESTAEFGNDEAMIHPAMMTLRFNPTASSTIDKEGSFGCTLACQGLKELIGFHRMKTDEEDPRKNDNTRSTRRRIHAIEDCTETKTALNLTTIEIGFDPMKSDETKKQHEDTDPLLREEATRRHRPLATKKNHEAPPRSLSFGHMPHAEDACRRRYHIQPTGIFCCSLTSPCLWRQNFPLLPQLFNRSPWKQ